MDALTVLICGGGVAAIEALLRLRRLAGDTVVLNLLCPGEELIYRERTVLVPFGLGEAERHPIQRIVEDAGAHWVRDRAASVDLPARTVHTVGGRQLHYDALLLAPGGRERTPKPHVSVFSDRTSGHLYRQIVQQLDVGAMRHVVLIEPPGPSWPLPLYELALLTAKHAHDRGLRPSIAVVTPQPRPLHAFGDEVGRRVEALLREAGIALHTRTRARVDGPQLLHLEPAGIDLHPDRIVTLPTITGPNLRGIPGDAVDRFISVDQRCRVRHTGGHIFAAGDATDLPVKNGSLAAQQADTAAAGIAHLAGGGPAPAALRPVLRGTLLTGDKPLYLEAYLIAGTGWGAHIHDQPPWRSEQLVVAEELAAYIANPLPYGSHSTAP
ncbi:FAD-dependent oxidoreductase [Terrabacter sp. MAHUQ-38]|uniref:FAD-dependent oxidoreductase n=1 Tax=unclassified Terrabacter TaxID=2630222 RepID=UPI00351C2232